MPGEVEDRQRLGRLAGRDAQGADAALERRDPLLEDTGRRVHDPGVDVAELLEPEQAGGVGGVVEDVAGGGVDRHGPGVRGRVDVLARVEGEGLGAEGGILVGHCDLLGADADGAAWPKLERKRASLGWSRGSPGVGPEGVAAARCGARRAGPGPEKQRTAALDGTAAPGPILGLATLLVEPDPQTPSSALRGRQVMAIMELRRRRELSLVAMREFSRRLKVWAFIGGEV